MNQPRLGVGVRNSLYLDSFRLRPAPAHEGHLIRLSILQTVLRQTEGVAKAEVLEHISVLEAQAAAAAEEKVLANAILEETKEHLNASRAQVGLHLP